MPEELEAAPSDLYLSAAELQPTESLPLEFSDVSWVVPRKMPCLGLALAILGPAKLAFGTRGPVGGAGGQQLPSAGCGHQEWWKGLGWGRTFQAHPVPTSLPTQRALPLARGLALDGFQAPTSSACSRPPGIGHPRPTLGSLVPVCAHPGSQPHLHSHWQLGTAHLALETSRAALPKAEWAWIWVGMALGGTKGVAALLSPCSESCCPLLPLCSGLGGGGEELPGAFSLPQGISWHLLS